MSEKRELVCINCPRGCELVAEYEKGEKNPDKVKVTGNFCPRGREYGKNEVTHPLRIVTSTAVVQNGVLRRVSVKTTMPVPKESIFSVMQEINSLRLTAPVHIGDILISQVLGLSADVVATKNVEAITDGKEKH
jgi:CxxC motif-containing protein